ncbi:MAG: universal stress protein [Firmicutes bacterium]|nr:universal stress protein [Bacillota bacterium]
MRVLIASDGSETALAAATWIAERLPALREALVLTAWRSSAEAAQAAAEATRRPLEERLPGRVRVALRRAEGPAGVVECILAALREHPADLLVAGSRGLNELEGMLLGSVSHGLVQRSPLPVLVFPARAAAPAPAGEERPLRLAVGSDGSPRALAAAHWVARHLPGALAAVVAVARFAPPGVASGLAGYEAWEEARRRALERAREAAEEAARAFDPGRPPAELHVLEAGEGSVAAALVDFAEGWGADLLALGRSGQGRLARLMLGSVTYAVLQRSRLPVLVVPEEAPEAGGEG